MFFFNLEIYFLVMKMSVRMNLDIFFEIFLFFVKLKFDSLVFFDYRSGIYF